MQVQLQPARLLARAISVLAGALLALALSVASASAILVKLPHSGYANYDAMSGARAPRAARIFDTQLTNLDYSGGPVMPSNRNYTIVWQPSNYGTHTAFQPNYTAGVDTFFTDMAADSGSHTNSDSVATQYNDVNGNVAAYQSSNGGVYTDTDPLPANGCPANPGDICITDAQIQAELDSFLASQGLPHDMTHEYYLLTPPDVASCFDSTGSQGCSANADTNQAYCAYHSSSAAGYIYANIPDLVGVNGCDPFVTYCPNASCDYNNGPADGVLSAISHEHNESITDPQPNSAWTDWGNDNVGGEIGDKCNNDGMNDPNLQFGGPNGASPYNEVVNGDHYLLQMEWSNQTTQCLDSFTPNGTVALASFTSSPGSGTTVNFNAGASTATGGVMYYVWQFNDGPGQTGTIETTSPTISHTFAAPGPEYVALTVMASDGTSNGTAQSVTVSDPSAAFSYFPSTAIEGTTVSFDGSSSTDPGGTIGSYAWNFGDGQSGSGPTASHSYAHYGTYTVSLTVTDAGDGAQSTVSRTVTVTDEAPTAAVSVSPSIPTAGSPALFIGSGSDSDGSISSYSWNFGDGATGSGAMPPHTYAAAGFYAVTLTVTDSGGQQASVQHLIYVAAPPAPVAAFSFTPGAPHTNMAVSFNGSASSQPGGSITADMWNFGDGGTGSGATVSHTYQAAGTYTVSLTVLGTSGRSTTVTHQITVSPASHGLRRACTVPKLKGKTLSQARRALSAGHCSLGKVTKPAHAPRRSAGHGKKWELVVSSQSPGARHSLASGSRVRVKLTYAAVKKG